MNTDLISLREFARRLNVGEKTIRDGVRLGKISKGVTLELNKPKIIFSIARAEAIKANIGHNSRMNKILSATNRLQISTGKTALCLHELQKKADQWHVAIPKQPVKILLPIIKIK
jgi:hypothetical protein